VGKRSDFTRIARDFYPTPYDAVLPLLPHLLQHTTFDEPCCGKGDLIEHLEKHEHTCSTASDVNLVDAFNITDCHGEMFITNPPWPAIGKHGDPTIAMALHLSSLAPTWFLLNADVAHNKYFTKVADRCVKIVAVGRVSWMENGIKGKENCCWMLFDKDHHGPTNFYGRV
jgi:hypothetical protein